MAIVEHLIAEWQLERASLVRRLQMLESGQLRTGIPMGSTTGATTLLRRTCLLLTQSGRSAISLQFVGVVVM